MPEQLDAFKNGLFELTQKAVVMAAACKYFLERDWIPRMGNHIHSDDFNTSLKRFTETLENLTERILPLLFFYLGLSHSEFCRMKKGEYLDHVTKKAAEY